MPIVLSQIEQNIVLQKWIGDVTVGDMQSAWAQINALLEGQSSDKLVTLIDGAEAKHIDLDLKAVINLVQRDPRGRGIYIFNAGGVMQVIAHIIGSMVHQKEILICDTYDEALRLARMRLELGDKQDE